MVLKLPPSIVASVIEIRGDVDVPIAMSEYTCAGRVGGSGLSAYSWIADSDVCSLLLKIWILHFRDREV
jgi:hypothetical protein